MTHHSAHGYHWTEPSEDDMTANDYCWPRLSVLNGGEAEPQPDHKFRAVLVFIGVPVLLAACGLLAAWWV